MNVCCVTSSVCHLTYAGSNAAHICSDRLVAYQNQQIIDAKSESLEGGGQLFAAHHTHTIASRTATPHTQASSAKLCSSDCSHCARNAASRQVGGVRVHGQAARLCHMCTLQPTTTVCLPSRTHDKTHTSLFARRAWRTDVHPKLRSSLRKSLEPAGC